MTLKYFYGRKTRKGKKVMLYNIESKQDEIRTLKEQIIITSEVYSILYIWKS